jgi:hypothetical protein
MCSVSLPTGPLRFVGSIRQRWVCVAGWYGVRTLPFLTLRVRRGGGPTAWQREMVGPQRYGSESRVPLGGNFPHCGFYPCVHRSSVRGTWLLRVELVLVGSRACGSTVPSLRSPTRPPFPAQSHAASLLLPLLRRGETIACSRSSARSVPSPARSVTRGQWGFRSWASMVRVSSPLLPTLALHCSWCSCCAFVVDSA